MAAALRDWVEVCEAFANGAGVLVIGLSIYWLVPSDRRYAAAYVATALGAGLACDLLKLLIARARPREIELATACLADTFLGAFPLLSGGGQGQSFPSAHAGVAVAGAYALSRIYPRGQKLFVLLAVCGAMQRVLCSAHFLSDVLLGALVGWCFAYLCCGRLLTAMHVLSSSAAPSHTARHVDRHQRAAA
jgi:membrane-associated phospholipid phosphatase